MSEIGDIAHKISALSDQWAGTLRTFGVWFGRPWDNLHTVTAVEHSESAVTVVFDKGERLTVCDPAGLVIEPKAIRIVDAARVRWQWVPYGSADGTLPEWRDITRGDKGCRVTTSGYPGLDVPADPEQPAVELLRL